MPPLLTINTHSMKKIELSPAGLKVRLGLIEIWLLEGSESKQTMRRVVVDVIKEIDEYMCSDRQ